MALADEIRAIRDRALAGFNSVYEYDTDTVIAWDVARQVVSDVANAAVAKAL